MSFIVNHDGVVYQKDLGPETAEAAAAITSFNPDSTWQRVATQIPVATGP
jgi:sensor domain CHASE-containing protein